MVTHKRLYSESCIFWHLPKHLKISDENNQHHRIWVSAEYTMFHLSWIIFNFSRNQLGTVSVGEVEWLVIISWNNEQVHEVINKINLLSKGFQSVTESHRYADTRELLSPFIFSPARFENEENNAENCGRWKSIPFIDK